MEENSILNTLKMAYEAFSQGCLSEYERLIQHADEQLSQIPPDEVLPLRGEYLLTAVLPDTRNVPLLINAYREAVRLLNGQKSRVMPDTDDLIFCSGDVFGFFYTSCGSAAKIGEQLKEAMSLYEMLTRQRTCNHTLYIAQYDYLHGDFDAAENLVYKGMYLAQASENRLYYQAAARLLAQISKHRNDTVGWRYAIRNMYSCSRQASDEQGMLRALLNCYRDELYMSIVSPVSAAYQLRNNPFPKRTGQGLWHSDYLLDGEFKPYPLMVWLHALYLLQKGYYAQSLSIATLAQETWGPVLPIFDLYYDVLSISALLGQGRIEDACKRFDAVVPKLAADGFWLIMAEFIEFLGDMVERLKMVDTAYYDSVMRIANGFVERTYAFRDTVKEEDAHAMLTPREREIAILVADGLRNAEIAEILCITERTVKTHMTNIFNKLSLNSRGKLVSYLNKLPV